MEGKKLTVEEMARIFGIPASLITPEMVAAHEKHERRMDMAYGFLNKAAKNFSENFKRLGITTAEAQIAFMRYGKTGLGTKSLTPSPETRYTHPSPVDPPEAH